MTARFSKRIRAKFGPIRNVEPASRACVAVKSAPVSVEWERFRRSASKYVNDACSWETASFSCATTTLPSFGGRVTSTFPSCAKRSWNRADVVPSSIVVRRSIAASFRRAQKVAVTTMAAAATTPRTDSPLSTTEAFS
jgi:hypothetical protein